jgi:hypothetical protein
MAVGAAGEAVAEAWERLTVTAATNAEALAAAADCARLVSGAGVGLCCTSITRYTAYIITCLCSTLSPSRLVSSVDAVGMVIWLPRGMEECHAQQVSWQAGVCCHGNPANFSKTAISASGAAAVADSWR